MMSTLLLPHACETNAWKISAGFIDKKDPPDSFQKGSAGYIQPIYPTQLEGEIRRRQPTAADISTHN